MYDEWLFSGIRCYHYSEWFNKCVDFSSEVLARWTRDAILESLRILLKIEAVDLDAYQL